MDNKKTPKIPIDYKNILCDDSSGKVNIDKDCCLAANNKMITDDNKKPKKTPKTPLNFVCEQCHFTTRNKKDYSKHLLTAKHKKNIDCNNYILESSIHFSCICGKEYKNRHNLCRHKKVCIVEDDSEFETVPKPGIQNLNSSMIMDIIKENQEIKTLLMEQSKQFMEQNNLLINKLVEREPSNNTTINSNNTTNNNQKFNLNLFLNETCKDAMNIQEFIDNIRITFEDLLTIGNGGFVNGVSDILIKQLRDLEVSKRPIHCTDSKRETIYLKEEAAWNKDDKDKTKLKQILEKIEYKNVAALHNWCNENPDSKVNNTPNNVLKDKIFYQTLQGDERNRDKIIKNVSKEVIVEKENP
jgi:hypothetical protein